jgi:polyisoprenoid-binding protein YceI
VSRKLKVLLAVVVVVVAAGGAGLWWFFRDDAPPEVDLSTAAESVEGDGTDASGGDDDGDEEPAATDGVAGTWTVDAESGAFDFESATGTFAGFRVEEELSSIGSSTAVGRTGDVSGTMTIEGTTVTAATFEVDLRTITTNESRRDDRVQGALETDVFPTATFVLAEPIELGAAAAEGSDVAVTAVGDLTIHGVTKRVEFPLEARLVDDTVVTVGSIDVTFSDFGVAVPTAPVVLSADDHGVLELQLLLTRSA